MQHNPFARTARLLRVMVPLLVVSTAVLAQDGTLATADSLPAMARASLGAARAEAAALRFAPFGTMSADLRRLYGDGAPELLWTRDGVLTASARAALDALQRVDERGLDSRTVEVARLREIATRPLKTESERFAFDAALSVAAIRTLRALRGEANGSDDGVGGSGDAGGASRVNHGIGGRPRALADTASSPAPTGVDFTADLRALATSTHPDALFDAAEPASAQYRLLKGALGTYRTLGLRDSVGREQLTRIVATMERARAERAPDMEAGVVVNIPAFRLSARGATGDTLGMDVVVGVARRHPTPEMRDSIRYLVFAPYWDVPASIVKAELLPIARRDPHVLTMNNYQILDSRGRVLVPTAKSVKAVAAGRARIRQLPGGTNSLGRVKFIFPNADDVYLHDTPMTRDFARHKRDLSHGCVRLADPAALARFLLRDQPEWTAERIEAAMNGTVPVTVPLTRPVPIHLTYATAVARADGSIDFFDDVYGLDASGPR